MKKLFFSDKIKINTNKQSIKDSRFFFKVVLEGSADSLDVHFSGIVGGSPVAAKLTDTIYKPNDSEEE